MVSSLLRFRPLPGTLGARLLLAGLVALLVFGACGSVEILRRARPARPLEVRYTIKRLHVLWLFTINRDTLRATLHYRGQELRPPAECPAEAGASRPVVQNAWRLPGAEARWLLQVRCGPAYLAYVLRLPASGPEFMRVGSISYLPYHRWPRLRPVAGGDVAYLAETDTSGWLVNWQARRSEAVVLPALWPVRWYPRQNTTYTVSPDQRVLARVYRPLVATSPDKPWLQAPGRQLVIDQYDLDRHSPRRLTVEGNYPPRAALLTLAEWTQTNGRWELLPRP
jgi:hypothetical protein